MEVYEYRFTRHRVAEAPTRLRSPRDVAEAVRKVAGAMLDDAESESLVVVALDTKNSILGVEKVYAGNVSSSLVRIAELMRFPVRLNAPQMILVHNHPSGDPTPSPDDLHLTATALAAARLLDIDLLDHIILGEGGTYISLRDRGIEFGPARR